MQKSLEIALDYAQKLASFFCDWPDEGWLEGDLEWDTLKRHAPTSPPGLSRSQIKLIKKATAFGVVAGRPETHPCSVEWCRGRLHRLRRAAVHYGMIDILEPCFDIGYRTAASRPAAAAPGSLDQSIP